MPCSVHILKQESCRRRACGEVAAERQHGREEGVERSELRGRALAGVHVRLAVPEAGRRLVGEVPVQGSRGSSRHIVFAVRVAEEPRALEQVLVVGIDPAADVAVARLVHSPVSTSISSPTRPSFERRL